MIEYYGIQKRITLYILKQDVKHEFKMF